MITREQVADLQPGDVVEYHNWDWPESVTITGPLYERAGCLMIGDQPIRLEDGDVRAGDYHKGTLTVVSRAPRPLYVNHPRTEPVPGDVVRDADRVDDERIWVKNVAGFSHEWLNCARHVYVPREELPDRLDLLVDGETGQVVP